MWKTNVFIVVTLFIDLTHSFLPCLSWTADASRLILTCRTQNLSYPISFVDKYGTEQAKCTFTGQSTCISNYRYGKVKLNLLENEVFFIITKNKTSDLDGKWTCRIQDKVQAVTEVSTPKGIVFATDVQLAVELKENNSEYELKLHCFSCWEPYLQTVEFLVNHRSADNVRYNPASNKCYHTEGECSEDYCSCRHGNYFSRTFSIAVLVIGSTYSCDMRFMDNSTELQFRKTTTVVFNGTDFIRNGSVTAVIKSPNSDGDNNVFENNATEYNKETMSSTDSNIPKQENIDSDEDKTVTKWILIGMGLVILFIVLSIVVSFLVCLMRSKSFKYNVEHYGEKKTKSKSHTDKELEMMHIKSREECCLLTPQPFDVDIVHSSTWTEFGWNTKDEYAQTTNTFFESIKHDVLYVADKPNPEGGLTCDPCSELTKEVVACFWCMDCEEAFCSTCKEYHSIMKQSRFHNCIDINALPRRYHIPLKCFLHEQMNFEYFCVDHDTLCCKECLTEFHRSCHLTVSIDCGAEEIQRSESLIDHTCEIEAISKTLNTIKRRTNVDKITLIDYEGIETSLLNLNISKVESNQSKFGGDSSQLFQNSKLSNELDSLISTCDQREKLFNFVKEHGSANQIFLLLHSTKDDLTKTQNRIKKLIDEMLESKMLSHWPNPELVTRKQRQSQTPVEKRERRITILHENNFKDMPGETRLHINSMITTANNTLLLCDGYKPRLIKCSLDGSYIDQVPIQHMPWDIAIIPRSHTAVMTGHQVDEIQFIDTLLLKSIAEKTVKGSAECGIAATSNNILVGSVNKIHVLDHKGLFQRTLDIKHTSGGLIRYISYIEERLWLTEYGSNILRCVDMNGMQLSSYYSRNIVVPMKAIPDKDGNIYILGRSSSKIHKLSFNGKLIDAIMTDEDGLHIPWALCFSNDFSKLYVANQSGSSILVLAMDKNIVLDIELCGSSLK